MIPSVPAERDVDLVLFEVGGRRWAADAWAVLRIDRRREGARTVNLFPSEGDRALVVVTPTGEVEVPIDRLIGFERVEARTLRPFPSFARALMPRALAGAWLIPDEEGGDLSTGDLSVAPFAGRDTSTIVLLIDLHTLVKEDVAGLAISPAAP